jgi:hypothetical protein
MPYMAMMIGQREQQLLPMTQTHAKELFETGNHVPMFVFCQNKALLLIPLVMKPERN